MIDGVFKAMKDRGLCRSRAHFSEVWLDKSPNYFATFAADMPLGTLKSLYKRLMVARQFDLAMQILAELLK